jgi:hypothetical protein
LPGRPVSDGVDILFQSHKEKYSDIEANDTLPDQDFGIVGPPGGAQPISGAILFATPDNGAHSG